MLHVIPSISMKDGGSSAAVRAMAAGIAAEGWDVVVATTDDDGDTRLPASAIPVADGDNPRYHVFPKLARSRWKYSRSLAEWVHKNAGAFDVMHVHGVFSYPTLPAVRAAHTARVPYVLTTNGTLGKWSLSQHTSRKRLYLSIVGRTIFAHAARIHATSTEEAAAVRSHWPNVTVAIVPLAAEAPPNQFVRLGAREVNALRVVFLGRLHAVKGVPVLLDAIARVRVHVPVHLTVAGGGTVEYARELESRAATLGIGDCVTFVGHVDGERRWQLLSDADVFALPSAHENFGIAAVEALSCGTPVLLSPDVAVASAVEAAAAGRVVPRDARAFARALTEMAVDEQLRTGMRRRAHDLARAEFSWPKTVRELIAVYTEAIGANQ